MGVITQAVMVQAAIDVNGMGQAQKVRLADEIFAQQPNLLASVLALSRMGVGMVELEVPLHIPFVTFQAMKRSGHTWPIVSEDTCCWPLSTSSSASPSLDPRPPLTITGSDPGQGGSAQHRAFLGSDRPTVSESSPPSVVVSRAGMRRCCAAIGTAAPEFPSAIRFSI